MLQACAVHTARQFARAVIMPNLVPPVTRIAEASAYRERDPQSGSSRRSPSSR